MTRYPIEVNRTAPDLPLAHVSLVIHQDDAEALSFALSDLLCWAAGYCAGCQDTDKHPYGVEAARDLNIALKRALNRKDQNR